ncbi:solute carrier organic anion transporter family member 3A1-like [Mytilus californianus]|uniref:solute carrier organic anion transporter family member 3A1-like n=1 Tax=Mytilus californianus TaxID=6549 RepID=UPI002246EC4B|nr:solute carrier organic anion transporter family member 3A1-like [Mytilus californianus]
MTKSIKDENNSATNHITNNEGVCGTRFSQQTCLQKCHNITVYSVMYGLTVLMTNALTVYISSQITTLERQFDLSSSQSGFILSCNDIGFTLTVLFVSHFGIRFHIPRVLSLFTIIYGLSGVSTSFLRFLSDHGIPSDDDNSISQRNKTSNLLCIINRNTTLDCITEGHEDSSGSIYRMKVAFILLCIFMGIQGLGKAPRSSLGTFYIDSNVPDKTRTGFYLGISSTMALFGPFLAITLGGVFGKIPVDLKETTMEPTDPRWIGAWWIGFLLFGVLGIASGLPLLCCPRNIVPADNTDKEKQKNFGDNSCCSVLKDIPIAIFRILRRPVYSLTILGLVFQLFGLIGGLSFGPKYTENQFNIPTWKANIILGAEKLVTATLGTFLGGYLTSRLKLHRQGCIRMCLVISAICISLNSLNFIFGCENPEIIDKGNSSPQGCQCEGLQFMAVCDGIGKTFYSPCHAGCTSMISNIYSSCSEAANGTVTIGICQSNCPYLIPYVVVEVLLTFVGTMSVIPVSLIILRSLEDQDKSIAFGMQSFILSLTVFIPAPIVFGYLFDSVCKEWSTSCGTKGACALYDIEAMRYTLNSVEVGVRLIVFVLYIFIFHIAKRDDSKKKNSENGHGMNKTTVI